MTSLNCYKSSSKRSQRGENTTGSLNAINCLQTLLSTVKILHAIVLIGHRLWHCSCWPKAKKTRGSVCLRFDIAVCLLASKPTFKIFFFHCFPSLATCFTFSLIMVCSQKEPNTIFWPNGSLKGGVLALSVNWPQRRRVIYYTQGKGGIAKLVA